MNEYLKKLHDIDHPPLVIAELSGNHNQSKERAIETIIAAGKAGAQVFKLQTYTADTLTIPADTGLFSIEDKTSLWSGTTLHQLYQKAYTPWEWHAELIATIRECGMLPLSTPFDESSVDFLEQFDLPAYKIASFENNHVPLLRKVASTRKPIIASTGLSTLSTLQTLVDELRGNGCENLTLLKCTSTYPATASSSNLRTIPHLRQLFNCEVGLSDHTLGIGVPIASVALGARVIEKHVTLDKDSGGVDEAFSLTPTELKQLVQETEIAYQALGNVHYGVLDTERNSLRFKRSIYVVKDIKAGEKLTVDNIRVIRPGDGLEPKYFEILLGSVARNDLKRATPLNFDDIL